MNYNKITIGGRLVKDPELCTTKDAKYYTPFAVAVNRPGQNAGAVFIECIAFDKTAEIVAKYFHKGSQILVEGRLDSRTVEKNGVSRVYWSVAAERVEFVDPKPAETKPAESFETLKTEDDLPF